MNIGHNTKFYNKKQNKYFDNTNIKHKAIIEKCLLTVLKNPGDLRRVCYLHSQWNRRYHLCWKYQNDSKVWIFILWKSALIRSETCEI